MRHVGRHESENETGVERTRCNSQGGLIWWREWTVSIAQHPYGRIYREYRREPSIELQAGLILM